MTYETTAAIAAILARSSRDKRVTSKAHELLECYASNLEIDGPSELHEFSALDDFAEPPIFNYQVIDAWDGDDPDVGLSHFDSILDAMKARIVEQNIEKLTNETVQMYWDEITETAGKLFVPACKPF